MPALTIPAALAARPVHRGLPVTYVTCWARRDDPIPTRTHPDYVETIWCHCPHDTPGEQPDFGRVCPARTIDAILGRLCGICGTPVAATELCWWPSLDLAPYYTEAPQHGRCLAYATSLCPHLVGMRSQRHARLVSSRDYAVGAIRRARNDSRHRLLIEPGHSPDTAAEFGPVTDLLVSLPDGGRRMSFEDGLAYISRGPTS